MCFSANSLPYKLSIGPSFVGIVEPTQDISRETKAKEWGKRYINIYNSITISAYLYPLAAYAAAAAEIICAEALFPAPRVRIPGKGAKFIAFPV